MAFKIKLLSGPHFQSRSGLRAPRFMLNSKGGKLTYSGRRPIRRATEIAAVDRHTYTPEHDYFVFRRSNPPPAMVLTHVIYPGQIHAYFRRLLYDSTAYCNNNNKRMQRQWNFSRRTSVESSRSGSL